jgi:hypothetical protein
MDQMDDGGFSIGDFGGQPPGFCNQVATPDAENPRSKIKNGISLVFVCGVGFCRSRAQRCCA